MPAAEEGVGHLRQRAGAAVGQPLAGVEGGVVHRLGGLQVDQQHRGAAALGDGQRAWRRHVRGEEADDEVAVGDAQLLAGRGALLRVGDEAGVDDVGVQRLRSGSVTRRADSRSCGSRSGNWGQ